MVRKIEVESSIRLGKDASRGHPMVTGLPEDWFPNTIKEPRCVSWKLSGNPKS